MKYSKLLLAGLLGLSFTAQAQTSVNATIGAVLAPGVFGRVDISNGVLPPVLYPQPMIIVPVAVAPTPVYMHVPPGHAKKWRKHCHKYNACGTPVYFVQANYVGQPTHVVHPHYVEHEGKKHKKHKKDKHHDDDHGHGGHGKHKS
jgi:hypothetical protein